MGNNYTKLSDKCFAENDYDGYLENARKQYRLTQASEDREKYEAALQNFEIHKEIQRIIKMDHEDYYRILGVTEKTSIQEIKKAFRTLAFKYHPNKTKVEGAATAMRIIQKAYFEINTEEKKAAYDAKISRNPFVNAMFNQPSPPEDFFSRAGRMEFTAGNMTFTFQSFNNPFHPNIADFMNAARNDSIYHSIYRNVHPQRNSRMRASNYLVYIYIIIFLLIISVL